MRSRARAEPFCELSIKIVHARHDFIVIVPAIVLVPSAGN